MISRIIMIIRIIMIRGIIMINSISFIFCMFWKVVFTVWPSDQPTLSNVECLSTLIKLFASEFVHDEMCWDVLETTAPATPQHRQQHIRGIITQANINRTKAKVIGLYLQKFSLAWSSYFELSLSCSMVVAFWKRRPSYVQLA